MEDKITLLLEDPDCFCTFTHAEYLAWAQDIVDFLATRDPRSVTSRAIRKAHSQVSKRLKNREYARQQRILKRNYVKSLERKIKDLTDACTDLNHRLDLLQRSQGMSELFFIMSEEQNQISPV